MIASGVSTMFQISTMSTWAVVQNWHSFAAEAVMITSSLMRRSSSPPGYTESPKPAKAARIPGRRHIAWSISTGAWPRSHRPRLSSNDGSSLTASNADWIWSGVTVTRTGRPPRDAHCSENGCARRRDDGGRECGGAGAGGRLGEPPATRSVRLGRRDAEDRVEPEAVEVPRGWTRARRAVRRGESAALDLDRPATLAVARGKLVERWTVADPLGRPFEDDVDALDPDRQGAARVRGEVAGLPRRGAAREPDVAVETQGTHAGSMRIAVRPHRAEEPGQVLVRWRGQRGIRPAPLEWRLTVPGEVLRRRGLACRHLARTSRSFAANASGSPVC